MPQCDPSVAGNDTVGLAMSDGEAGNERWQFTRLPNGAYLVQGEQRHNASCTASLLSTNVCTLLSPNNDTVSVYGLDDGSGASRQLMRAHAPDQSCQVSMLPAVWPQAGLSALCRARVAQNLDPGCGWVRLGQALRAGPAAQPSPAQG